MGREGKGRDHESGLPESSDVCAYKSPPVRMSGCLDWCVVVVVVVGMGLLRCWVLGCGSEGCGVVGVVGVGGVVVVGSGSRSGTVGLVGYVRVPVVED